MINFQTSTPQQKWQMLQIRDGGSDSAAVLGRYCGAQVPGPVTSTGNLMFARFVTDGSVQNLGFEAAYTSEDASCGGRLTALTG